MNGLALACLLAGALSGGCQPESPQRVAGETETVAATELGEHVHRFELEGERLHRLRIDPRGNDLKISIYGPGGEFLRKTGGNGRTWGLESVSFASRVAGAHEVRVEVVDPRAGPNYLISMESSRAVEARDDALTEAEELLAQARRLRSRSVESNRDARDLAMRAAESLAETRDELGETIATLEAASICADIGDWGCVLERSKHSLTLAEKLGDQRLLEQALGVVGLGEAVFQNYNAAASHLERVFELEERTQCPRCQARAHVFLAFLQFFQSLPRTDTLQRAQELFHEAGDLLGQAEAHASLGQSYRHLGEMDAATRAYRLARELLEAHGGDPRAEAALYNNLGVHLRQRGEVHRAEEAYGRALEILRSTGFGPRAELYTNIGRFRQVLGDYDGALEYHQQVMELQPANALIDIGWVNLRLGRYPEALSSFREALDLIPESNDEILGWALQSEGLALLRAGLYDEAERSFQRALGLFRAKGAAVSEAITLSALAELEWLRGSESEASLLLAGANALAEQLGDPHRLAMNSALAARIARARGDLDTSLAAFQHAIDQFESVRADLVGSEKRALFFATGQDFYVDFISLLAELARQRPDRGYEELAFDVSERARARSLVDLLRSAQLNAGAPPDSPLIERRAVINARLQWLKDAIERIVSEERPDVDAMQSLKDEVEALRREQESIDGKIRETLPRYAELTSPRPLRFEQVRSLLDDGSVLLQFVIGEQRSFLLVASRDGVDLVPLAVDRLSVDRLVSATREALLNPRAGKLYFVRAAHRVYEALLAPAAESLDRANHWIIVPDGALYSLPFEALPITGGAGSQFLIQRKTLSYAPSATTLATLRSRSRSDSESTAGFVGIADAEPANRPLPGARSETERIGDLFSSRGHTSQIMLGSEASEEAFKRAPTVRRARWLHVATHGELDGDDPSRSGLLLAIETDGEDGRLTSGEVSELRIDADLVTLSACQSGLGRELRGEGIVGLTRAFMHAGAPTVVVSLWQVEDDSTQELMVEFYERLQRGAATGDAIRSAKLELLASPHRSHPFYWAPFVLVGRAS